MKFFTSEINIENNLHIKYKRHHARHVRGLLIMKDAMKYRVEGQGFHVY